jgi:hypothetical protein
MAHDSKYSKLSGDCCEETTAVKSSTDTASDLQPLLSEHDAARAKLSQAGKHKGSYLYTKYDK